METLLPQSRRPQLQTTLQSSPSSSHSLLFSFKVICNPQGPLRSNPMPSPIMFQDASGVTAQTIRKCNALNSPSLLKRVSSGTTLRIVLSMAPQAKKSHQCSIRRHETDLQSFTWHWYASDKALKSEPTLDEKANSFTILKWQIYTGS